MEIIQSRAISLPQAMPGSWSIVLTIKSEEYRLQKEMSYRRLMETGSELKIPQGGKLRETG